MRLGIRYRLLVPLAVLLLGVVGASLWSARVAARRAEARVTGQVRNVSQTLSAARYPLTDPVLNQIKSFSGAEFLILHADGSRLTTFATRAIDVPSDEAVAESDDRFGPPVIVESEAYRCRRVLLREPNPNAGDVVYIFYPESLLEEAIADAERPSFLGLVFGLVAVGLTFGIGQRVVGRIRALDRQTRRIAGGEFGPMPLPSADDELRDLTAAVNEMAVRLDRLQQAVQRTERLRLSNQLASGLAHQLRNGATGAKLALQLYLADPAADREALDVTLRQLAGMEANLRRFIDLGRPGDGKREPTSIREVLTEIIELHRPRCKHAGIELTLDAPIDVSLHADRGQLGDLFGNLIGNALDAVGTNGEVAVTVRSIEATVVEVSDTGPGPAPDVAERLFEPFATGKPEGIGLGLAVARHAAEAHGGRIDWRREASRTVFRVTLPATDIA